MFIVSRIAVPIDRGSQVFAINLVDLNYSGHTIQIAWRLPRECVL